MQDPNSQVFSYLDYEAATKKMTRFSGFLTRNITQKGKFFKRDEDFLRNGEGNVVFVETEKDNHIGSLNNIEILLTLYDLIKRFRSKEYLQNLKFYYVTPNSTLFSKEEQSLDDFYRNELIQRNINIIYDKVLKVVSFDHFLHFENDFKLEFNYCHVIPRSLTPSFLKYSEICGFKRKNEFVFDKEVQTNVSEVKNQKGNKYNKIERPW